MSIEIKHRVERENAAFNFTLGENEFTCVFEGEAATEPWPLKIKLLWKVALDEFVDVVAHTLKLVEFTQDGPRTIPTSFEHRRAVALEACQYPEGIIERGVGDSIRRRL